MSEVGGKHEKEAHYWRRDDIADALACDDVLSEQNLSQRQRSAILNIPRSTLQRWENNRAQIDLHPQTVAFLESPVGLEFLHQLLVAAEFTFTQEGAESARQISQFLELSKLSSFVASSYGHEHERITTMETLIGTFGDKEIPHLASQMPHKEINIVEDETFHPEVCLVGIEPESNFIFTEEYSKNRTGEAWNEAVKRGLKDFKVTVIQVGSDGASGLLNHAKIGLMAHHAHDIFHVTYDISKALGASLASKIRKAEEAIKSAQQKTEVLKLEQKAYERRCQEDADNCIVGHSNDLKELIEDAEDTQKQAVKDLESACQRQTQYREALQGISDAYHPCCLETGAPKNSATLKAELTKQYNTIERIAREAEASENSRKLINKSKNAIDSLVATLHFFWFYVLSSLGKLNLSTELESFLKDRLIPAIYWKLAAKKMRKAPKRNRMLQRAGDFLKAVLADPIWASLNDHERKTLMQAAEKCAKMFLRSTSCVEGRNGKLSSRHLNFHRLSARKMKALTVLHNFYRRDRRNKTPAEMFFENKHADLFDYLLEKMPLPGRPKVYPEIRKEKAA